MNEIVIILHCCRAANVMKSTGQRVTLKVAKRAALHHGLGTLLGQPSPLLQQHAGIMPCMLYYCDMVKVSLVRLRPVWMTNHPPSVLRHC